MSFSDETFVLFFKLPVYQRAMWDARALYDDRYFNQHLIDPPEKRKQLALQETTKFYQSGRLLFILKASWLGSQPLVTSTYYSGFIEIYNDLMKQSTKTKTRAAKKKQPIKQPEDQYPPDRQ